jgi:anthranilate phosphoribosyltransferase
LDRSKLDDLQGGNAKFNAEIIKSIMKGEATQPQEDIVTLNAAFAIQASGKTDKLEEALSMARESIASGAAKRKLREFAQATQEAHLVRH